jgi:putative FmdB family regulatory protein
MPLYEYVCDACQHRFEIIQKFSDGPPDACPKCGKGPLQRQFSSPAIQFKGTGWYVTDYAGKGKGGGPEAKPASEKSESSSSDSGSTSETKKADTPSTPAAAPSTTKD